MKNVIFVLAFMLNAHAFAANTEKYCNAIAEIGASYVEDRNARVPYDTTLITIEFALEKAKLTPSEQQKYRRDMRAAAKVAYIDFPQITTLGMIKLVRFGCMSE